MNGNSGVLRSMMGEITDTSNMAQAVAFLPMVWFTGSMIGRVHIKRMPLENRLIDRCCLSRSFIGGILSDPYPRFHKSFTSKFWREYPYFLPCLVVAAFPAFACFLVFLAVEEVSSFWRDNI